MLSLNLYIQPEYHNNILLDFVKPLFDNYLKDKKINGFIFKRYALDHSPHIRLFVYNPFDSFEKEFGIARDLFFKNNPIFSSSNDNEIGNTIFLKYPQGHIEVDRENHSSITNEENLFKITNTSIDVIQHLQEHQEEADELQINATLVLMYALGGYSKDRIIKTNNALVPQLNFTSEDKIHLNEQVNFILTESLSYLKTSFKDVLEELYTYHNDSYSSVVSTWKYTLGMLGDKHIAKSQNKLEYFNLFRNQISLSDAESYCILQIITRVLTSGL
jgi:hypothetical protein